MNIFQICFRFILLFFCIVLTTSVSYAGTGFSYSGVIKDASGVPVHGNFDIKATLWNTEKVGETDVNVGKSDYINIFAPGYLGFFEDQTLTTNDKGEFNITIGRFSPFPKINPPRQIFVQIDVKRAGFESNLWETLDLNTATTEVERIGMYSGQLNNVISFNKKFGSYSGVLLNNKGVPRTGKYIARFSLWKSADVDNNFDFLKDRTLNTIATNFVGYSADVTFVPDASGKFTIPLGNFTPIDEEILKHQLFMQIEFRNALEPLSKYEIIDPDGDIKTSIDRFKVNVKDNTIEFVTDANGIMNSLGDSGSWVVSRIPGGTSSKMFEIGVGNTNPNATIEIRANQGSDPKGIIRYNGYSNRWEVSNDGKEFKEIGSISEFFGTNQRNFTIGLDGKTSNTPLSLIFGTKIGATLSFDTVRNIFSFNKPIDFSQNELINAVFQNLAVAPKNPKPGQQYYNTTDNEMYFYNGKEWKKVGGTSSVTNISYGGGGGSNTTTTVTQIVNVPISGTDSESFTLNQDGTPTNTDIDLIAKQGIDPDGIIRYNATLNLWEISNNGGPFAAISTSGSAETLTNKTISGATNTLTNIGFSSLSSRLKTEVFEPDIKGIVVSKDGTSNQGTLELENDDVARNNYYRWTTKQGTGQDIDLVLRWQLPEDFVSMHTAPLELWIRTNTILVGDNAVDVTMNDTVGAVVAVSGGAGLKSTAPDTWLLVPITFSGSPTFAPGGVVSTRVKLSVKNLKYVDLGRIVFKYNGR